MSRHYDTYVEVGPGPRKLDEEEEEHEEEEELEVYATNGRSLLVDM